MKIQTRVILGFGTVTFILLLVGIIAIVERNALDKAFSDVDQMTVFERNINDARYILQEIHADIFRYSIERKQKQNDLVRDLDRRAVDFYKIVDRLSEQYTSKDFHPNELQEKFKAFYISSKRILSESKTPNDTIDDDQLNQFLRTREEVVSSLKHLESTNNSAFMESVNAFRRNYDFYSRVSAISLGSGIFFAFITSVLLAHGLNRSVRQLLGVIESAENQQFKTYMPVESKSEFGRIAKAFNTMTARLHITLQDLKQEIKQRKQTEKALRENEQRLQILYEQAADAIWIVRLDGQIERVNEQACQMTGYAQAELLGMNVIEINADINTSDELKKIQESVPPQRSVVRESHHKRKDGSVFPVETMLARLETPDGPRLMGIVRDITERKRAEEVLRDNERKLHAIFDHHYQLTGLLDTEGRLLAANRTALQFAGVDESQVLGEYFWDTPWWGPSQKEQLQDMMKRAAGGEFVRVETTHPAKDGVIHAIDFSLSPVKDDNGNVVYIVPEGRDITEIQQSAEALKKSEEQHRQLFESANYPILLLESGKFIDCNPKTYESLGCSREQIIGRTPFHFSPEIQPDGRDSKEKALEMIHKAFAGQPQFFEWRHVKYDGTPFDVEVSLNRLELFGKVYVQAMWHDITERKQAEKALQEREEQQRRILDTMMDGLTIINEKGEFLFLNDAFCKMYGYSREEFSTMAVLDLVHPDYHHVFERYVQDIHSTGYFSGETVESRKDGTLINIEVKGAAIQFGGQECFLAIVRDITERKQAEVALKESEQRFRTLVDNIPGVSYHCVHDEHWTMKFISSEIQALSGYPATDFQENAVRSYASIIHPEDRQRIQNTVMQCLENRKAYTLEYRIIRSDGQACWVFEKGQGLFDMTGSILYLDGVIVDVTERKQAEKAIQESEEKYRLLFESANDAIFLMEEGRFIDCNQKACEIYGCTRQQLIGQTPIRFSPEYQPDSCESREKVLEKVENAYQGQTQFFEWQHIHYDGTLFDAEVSLNRLELPDKVYLQAMVRDITERKLAEEELREYRENLEEKVKERTHELAIAKDQAESADRLKSAFLAAMSHELRTPLNSIIGFTGIMQKEIPGPLNEEQKKQLGMVKNSSRHLLCLINDVLDISKIEAGQMEMNNEPFDMIELIETNVQLLIPLAKSKGLELTYEVSRQVGRIIGDGQRTQQILINFVNNAIKFTNEGSVHVECRAADEHIITRIIDTGIGIKEKDLKSIFKPFQQVDSGLTRVAEGTGLGLSICKKLVELLGGTIQVQSEWGKGSTFTFILPVKKEK